MIDVGSLNALRSVASLGTLVRAADELGFTASAISQQIKRLERQLGVALLAPAGRGVILTSAGDALLAAAPDVFQSLERCAEAARSAAQGTPTGVLRVAAFSTAIRGLLSPHLPSLRADYPSLRVQITEQDPDQALHSVTAGTADLAVIHDADGLEPPLPAALTWRLLHTDVGDLVLHRSHPLAADQRAGRRSDVGHQSARHRVPSMVPSPRLRPVSRARRPPPRRRLRDPALPSGRRRRRRPDPASGATSTGCRPRYPLTGSTAYTAGIGRVAA